MRKIISVFCFFIFTCSLQASSINIAVAANVSYAIDDLKAAFKKVSPETDVKVTLGSSGKLTAQILNGAPYDVFMAANMKYPKKLHDNKVAVTKPVIYAQGSLAYLSVKKQDFSKGIKLLEDKKIEKIAVANPKTAPYGKAAIEAMKKAKIYENVKSKIVFAESISQTVAYTTKAADIGIIAKSSLYSPKMKMYKRDINWKDVDTSLYTPIDQGIVVLKNAGDKKEAKAFYDFILSNEAKKIFKQNDYLVP